MNRRSLLGSLALLAGSGLAGCAGDLAGTADNDGPRTTERTPTGTVEDPAETTATPTSTTSKPAACPWTMDYDVEPPNDLTEESVEEFVAAYEEAYIWDQCIDADPENASVSVESPSAEPYGEGYAVEVTFTFSARQEMPGSQSIYHDSFGTTVLYYVDDVLVRRRESPAENADPREGVLMECE